MRQMKMGYLILTPLLCDAQIYLYSVSTSELLHSLHWLPVESRIVFKIAAIIYKVLTTGQPNYLRELLNYYTPHRTSRT